MTRKEKYLAAMEDQYSTGDGMCLCVERQFSNPYSDSWHDLWLNVPEFVLFHPEKVASCWGWNLWGHAWNEPFSVDELRQTILAFCVAMCED